MFYDGNGLLGLNDLSLTWKSTASLKFFGYLIERGHPGLSRKFADIQDNISHSQHYPNYHILTTTVKLILRDAQTVLAVLESLPTKLEFVDTF